MNTTATAPMSRRQPAGHAAAPQDAPSALGCERVAALPAAREGLLGALDYCRSAAAGEAGLAERIGLVPLAAPAGGIDVWHSAAPATAGRTGGVGWRSSGGWLFGSIALDETAGAGIEALAQQAYRELFAALDATGHPHLLRLWNYLPSINGDDAGLERYRRFNLGRQRAFAEARRDMRGGAPAACALGVPGGPLRVAFLAGRAAPLAVENPRQVPAWNYPPAYGPASPTFSRAALADAGGGRVALFVSGTASIVGHASLHAGDVEAQAQETLANLDAIVGAARQRCSAAFSPAVLAPVVYLRRPQDAPRVRAVLAGVLGADAPALRRAVFVQGDVCRSELLVEIEAHAVLPGVLHAAATAPRTAGTAAVAGGSA